MTQLMEQIQQRHSTALLEAPAPTSEEWSDIIQTAITAPDHGRLKPWQFRLIQGEGLKSLGELFSQAQQKSAAQNQQELTEQQLERTRSLPSRAPAILVVVAKIQENHKIPVIEQITASAAAAQNTQLALMSLGYGCMWRTGDFAFDNNVKHGLGFEAKDEIIGFLYVGTPTKQPQQRTPQDITTCFETQKW